MTPQEIKETALFRALNKALNDEQHAFFYFFGITAHPENIWITPTNKNNSQDYSFFSFAHNEANAVICKRSPIWRNGSRKGDKVEFKYNLKLEY